MSHQPFRDLTKHFSPERRAYIEAGKAKIREEVAEEKAARELAESSSTARSPRPARAATSPLMGRTEETRPLSSSGSRRA